MTERWGKEEWEGVDLPPVKPAVGGGGESAGAGNAGEPHGKQMAACSTPREARTWGWVCLCGCR